jgi:hypothetical protein
VDTISKFEPHRTLYLKGFDRRGAAASIHNATSTAFTVSGVWSDLADFVVLMLFDADDNFGHLTTSKYLPDFDLTNVVLDFDLSITNGMYPGSAKYQSVPWGGLSWVKTDGTKSPPNGTPLNITSTTGGIPASRTYTVNGSPVAYDRVQLCFDAGHVVFDYLVNAGDSTSAIAAGLVAQINGANAAHPDTIPLTAVPNGSSFTVTCTQPGTDGNTIELIELHKTATTYITPSGPSKLMGGVDPTSFHVRLDFSAVGLTSLRTAWLTLAPPLPIDSGSPNPAVVPFTAREFSYVFSNWTVTDPAVKTPLKVAGPGSVVISSADSWTTYSGSGWAQKAGFFYQGFAQASGNTGDSVKVKYSCQSTHDLYLGTYLVYGGGTFHVKLDGVAQPDRSTALEGAGPADSPFSGRRILAAAVAPGIHMVELTIAGGACCFDYIQACVRSDVPDPSVTYPNVNAALDFDTDQTYKIAPARALWILNRAGFTGDIDFYAGVFFALKRVRSGGSFHQATVTISPGANGFNIGNLSGNGDAMFLQVGGAYYRDKGSTAFGVAVYPTDTLSTLAQRFVNGINALFVSICAAPGSTPGQFTITSLTPINGFTFFTNYSAGTGIYRLSPTGAVTDDGASVPSTGSISSSGDILAGNEGTWQVDASQTAPLNRAFADYLTDFANLVHAAGQTLTVAFSQELLAPPDQNTAAGSWSQRFANGQQVLTATGFGSWGAGFVEAVSGSGPVTITQTGHGYITGNTVHIAGGSGGGVWSIAVLDADHYQLTTQISTGSYTPGVGDATLIDLQTTQCNFNPATVTPYLTACYQQAAGILAGAGLTPWLQFGEVGWWFFGRVNGLQVGYASYTAPTSIGTNTPHTLATGDRVIVAGVEGDTAANGEWTITKTADDHFTLNGSSGNGNYVPHTGTVCGGGMAYYDAYTLSGRTLGNWYTQDDDPSTGSHGDANYLRGLVYAHMHVIAQAVKSSYPNAKFEWLLPLDVNNPSVYWNQGYPYPQGGRLNNYVNIPAQYMGPNGDIDRVKLEALSWGASYLNLDLAKVAMAYASSVLGYPKSATAYLIPWFNGASAWQKQYLAALDVQIPLIGFWAIDHLCLLSWPLPLPVNAAFSRIQ